MQQKLMSYHKPRLPSPSFQDLNQIACDIRKVGEQVSLIKDAVLTKTPDTSSVSDLGTRAITQIMEESRKNQELEREIKSDKEKTTMVALLMDKSNGNTAQLEKGANILMQLIKR